LVIKGWKSDNLLALELSHASSRLMPSVPQVNRLELPLERCQLRNNESDYNLKKINPSVIVLWSVFYLEEMQYLSALGEQPMIQLDPLDRQFAQAHWLMLLVAEVLVEEEVLIEGEMVLATSGFLVKKGMMPHESIALDEEEKAVLSSDVLVVTWCSWVFSLDLTGLGASALALVLRFLLVCQSAVVTSKIS